MITFFDGLKLAMFPWNANVGGVFHLIDSVTRSSAPRMISPLSASRRRAEVVLLVEPAVDLGVPVHAVDVTR